MSGSCSHVVGLIFTLQHWLLLGLQDIPAEVTCTSLPQQWNIPRGKRIASEPICNIIVMNPKQEIRKKRPVMSTFTDNRLVNVSCSLLLFPLTQNNITNSNLNCMKIPSAMTVI